MQKPKMILFDYGHTLICEPGFDTTAGIRAVMKYAVSNPGHLSAEEIAVYSDKLFQKVCVNKARGQGVECHEFGFENLLYGLLGIEFSISPEKIEQVFADSAAPGIPMEDIGSVMDYLADQGIRSGVVSNISHSGRYLKNRIDRLVPNNRFEFVITSSEYIVRKPDPLLFKVALRKAKLSADEVWYCGDDAIYDIEGAHAAGIFPVWYRSPMPCYYRDRNLDAKPDCDCLSLRNWRELVETLQTL